MSRESAGLLMYRRRNGHLEFLLAHPGGPFYQKKEHAVWSIPKGEIEPGEDPLATARREFSEELGLAAEGEFISLTPIKQKSGKVVRAWAFEGDCDPATCRSNNFSLEWPPRSGKLQEFPEVDRAAFFDMDEALVRIHPNQADLLRELAVKLSS